MSYGGGKRPKETIASSPTSKPTNRASSDEFSRAISRTAAAQICSTVGFDGSNASALDALSDIAIRYIRDLGKTASFYANSSGRTQCNVFDIVQALEDLSTNNGNCGSIASSSSSSTCILSCGVVTDMMEYIGTAEEIPFAQPVPRFPVVRQGTFGLIPSFAQMGETPDMSFKHVPDWLPAFPDPHTYKSTPVWNERVTDPRADKIELARQRRKAERSLLSLQQRLVCNGEAVVSGLGGFGNDVENGGELKELEKNPFLAKPIEVRDKGVPDVVKDKLSEEGGVGVGNGVVSIGNFVSLLETFTPAIEAMKDGLSDSGNSVEEQSIVPDKRPVVCLEFKSGKKGLGESLDLRIRKKTSGKTAPWFKRDEEKDDKKRRAELILRQSMESQQELSQL